MFSIIPISLIIISFGLLLYIVSRHISEINMEEQDLNGRNRRLFDYISERIDLDGVKSKSVLVAEKSLHRARRVLLKADNVLMSLIGKMKNGNGQNGQKTEGGKVVDNFWQNIIAKRNSDSKIRAISVKTMDIKPALVKKTGELSSKKGSQKTDLPA